jgi:hypothetical protein
MPTPEIILAGLKGIANDWKWLAIFWHIYFATLVLGLSMGGRPSKRITGILLGLPFFSVSTLAWLSGNPFNGTLFALSGIVILVLSIKLPMERIRIAPPWAVIAGTLMFVFGWIYPHFLESASFLPYLYAAPTGLIPCPTLSIIIGLAIILGGLESRAWSLFLGIIGVFYSIFGAARLGVTFDWVLLLGALIIMLSVFIGKKHRMR